MRASRFNWVSRHIIEGLRLVVNPLSCSADLLDAADEGLLLRGDGVGALDPEDAQVMTARGYIHPTTGREDELLERLWAWEEEHFLQVVGVHLGVNGTGRTPDFTALSSAIENRLAQRRPGAAASVAILARSVVPPLPSPGDLAALARHCCTLGANLTVVVTPSSLPFFTAVLAERLADSVVFSARLDAGEDPAAFTRRIEAPLDELVYRRWPVVLELSVGVETVPLLPALANEMIRRGWPIQGNFHCRLVPTVGARCDFGLAYPADVKLASSVLAVFADYPQTQFLRLDGWIGVRILHTLIWHGRLPAPSLHFCAASRGLIVLAADGSTQPCPQLVEAKAGEPPRPFQHPQREWLANCAECRFLPACGGGCRLAACGDIPTCPPVGELIETAAEAWLPELLAKAAYVERRQVPYP